MILTNPLAWVQRCTEMSSILIGMSFFSFLAYWTMHFRRELMVIRNILDYASSLALS